MSEAQATLDLSPAAFAERLREGSGRACLTWDHQARRVVASAAWLEPLADYQQQLQEPMNGRRNRMLKNVEKAGLLERNAEGVSGLSRINIGLLPKYGGGDGGGGEAGDGEGDAPAEPAPVADGAAP